ncbi:MAG TPA: acyltransferase family protein [Acidimicrobiales bacterium]|nr:acyltransferase family protein [Acidimicrobiales bacterium]
MGPKVQDEHADAPTLTVTRPDDRSAPGHHRPAADPGGIGYRPALDGLRGLALLGVVLYHAHLGAVPAGFLGVSTFFTLSGFLITSVTLVHRGRTGSVDVRRFYARRIRRLLPAAVATVAALGLATVVLGSVSQVVRIRGDGLATLLYALNWRLVLAGDSYGDLFAAPSPFIHFWSLAIEEQFYLVFPLVVAALAAVAARRRGPALAGAFAAVAFGATAWCTALSLGGTSVDRLYFGTDTRVAEIAAGCLAGLWWLRHPEPGPTTARALRVAGAVALLATLWSWHAADRTSPVLFRGGLTGYAGLTVLVILAALQPGAAAGRLLAWRPLVVLGTLSYGAYLYHWPIFLWLRMRTPLPPLGVLTVGSALTLLLASLSHRWLEQPVRAGRWPTGRAAPAVAVAAVVLTAGLVANMARWRTFPPPTDYETAAEQLAALGAPSADDFTSQMEDMAVSEELQARVAASTAPRVAFFGDSTALMTGLGVGLWAVDHLEQLAPAGGFTGLGCGLLDDAVRLVDGRRMGQPEGCEDWLGRWGEAAEEARVDVAVVQFGLWDLYEQRIERGGDFLTIGEDPELDAALLEAVDDAATTLLARSEVVLLVTTPDVVYGRIDGRDPPRRAGVADPARVARFRELEAEVAARHDRVEIVDLAGWIAAREDDGRLRPDGLHFTDTTTLEVAEWLAPEIVRLRARVLALAPVGAAPGTPTGGPTGTVPGGPGAPGGPPGTVPVTPPAGPPTLPVTPPAGPPTTLPATPPAGPPITLPATPPGEATAGPPG